MKFFQIALLLLTLVTTFSASAIVNVDKLHIGSAEEGFRGSVNVSARGSSGNTENSRTRLGLNTQWSHSNQTEILTADYQYGRSLGQTDIDKAFLHGRHIHAMNEITAIEGFAQLESNRFARLNLRALAGLGTRITVGNVTPRQGIYFGLGAFVVQEDIADDTSTSDSGSKRFIRGNIYLVFKRALDGNVELYTTTYIQPVIDTPEDIRLLEDLSMKYKLTNKLGLRLSLNISHDSKPPANVKETDITYMTGLELNF